jgi:hypothetical protein
VFIAALPAKWLSRHVGDPTRARHWNVLLSSLLVLALTWVGESIWPPGQCFVRLVAGVPCPFCGVTHAVMAAVHGHWAASLDANIGGALFAAILMTQVPLRAAVLAGWVPMTYVRDQRLERVAAAVIVAGCLISYAGKWIR